MQVPLTVRDGLAGIKHLVQTLQDQLDSDSRADGQAAPGTRSSTRTAALHRLVRHIDCQQLAAQAAWALANLAAGNKNNQNAVRWGPQVAALWCLLSQAAQPPLAQLLSVCLMPGCTEMSCSTLTVKPPWRGGPASLRGVVPVTGACCQERKGLGVPFRVRGP